jgi:transposase
LARLHRVQAVEIAEARRHQLTAQIQAMLPGLDTGPRGGGAATMRGLALVNAAILIAELGDLSRFAKPRQLWLISGWYPSEHFERYQRQTRGHHQGR